MGQRYDSSFRHSSFVVFKNVRHQQPNDEMTMNDAMAMNDEMATLPESRFGETPNSRIFTARITFIFHLFFWKKRRFSKFFLHMGSV